jgi:hypothetical protein
MMKSRRTAPAKPVTTKAAAEQVVKAIRRTTRKLHSSEEKLEIELSVGFGGTMATQVAQWHEKARHHRERLV